MPQRITKGDGINSVCDQVGAQSWEDFKEVKIIPYRFNGEEEGRSTLASKAQAKQKLQFKAKGCAVELRAPKPAGSRCFPAGHCRPSRSRPTVALQQRDTELEPPSITQMATC